VGYQFGLLLKLLVLRSIESPAGLPALTFRGQCRNVGTWNGRIGTSSRSDLNMTVAAIERAVTAGESRRWIALAPKLQEVRFALMNEWQDECFPKSHDDEIYSLRPIVSSSIPDRNDEEYLSL